MAHVTGMIRLILASALCLAASLASAATIDGVTFPDSYALGGQRLVLNGVGSRTLIFGIRIYAAALYLPQSSRDASAILRSAEPKVLILHYLHSGSKEEVQKEYRKGEQVNCGDGSCPGTDATDFDRLVALTPGVEVGDTTTYLITDRGLTVLANNATLAEFANRDLGFRILLGFIGPHPPTESLKEQLLGQSHE